MLGHIKVVLSLSDHVLGKDNKGFLYLHTISLTPKKLGHKFDCQWQYW